MKQLLHEITLMDLFNDFLKNSAVTFHKHSLLIVKSLEMPHSVRTLV